MKSDRMRTDSTRFGTRTLMSLLMRHEHVGYVTIPSSPDSPFSYSPQTSYTPPHDFSDLCPKHSMGSDLVICRFHNPCICKLRMVTMGFRCPTHASETLRIDQSRIFLTSAHFNFHTSQISRVVCHPVIVSTFQY